jgi:hypothetical protein
MHETTSTPALPRQPDNGTNPPVPAEATKTPTRQGRPAPLDWFRMAMTPLRRIMRRGA